MKTKINNMKTKIYQKVGKRLNIISLVCNLFVLTVLITHYFKGDILYNNNTEKYSENCVENYKEEIDKLKTKIYNDSIALTLIENEYYEVWEENQIFSSMLSEIENEPGGHEILQKLWNEKR